MSVRLLTLTECADRLGLSLYRVRNDAALGILPTRRPGRAIRCTEDDLEEYVARLAVDHAGVASGLTRQSQKRRRSA